MAKFSKNTYLLDKLKVRSVNSFHGKINYMYIRIFPGYIQRKQEKVGRDIFCGENFFLKCVEGSRAFLKKLYYIGKIYGYQIYSL